MIRDFIKSIIKELIIVCCITLLFYIVFYLNDLDLAIFKVAAEIILLFFGVYVVVLFLFFKKEKSKDEKIKELSILNSHLKSDYLKDKADINDYFSIWIHQIKTPLTAAKIMLDRDNINKSELKNQLIYIEDYTNMALNYLKIRDFERDMYFEEVMMDDMIRPILKKYSVLFIKNHISLDYEKITDTIVIDSKWFTILLEQILSNAIKYTKNGRISIKYDEKAYRLSISDTGVGIRTEDIPRIFDRGYSGFNGRLNEKSSGLGLFLADEIAKKLLLEIQVSSTVNKGSEFSILLKR